MKTKFINNLNTTIITFIFLFCSFNNLYSFNLTISFNDNQFQYSLKDSSFSYNGNNVDTLKQTLHEINANSEECVKNGGKDKQCFYYKMLFDLPENLEIYKLFRFLDIFYCIEGNAQFDLKIGKKILHILAITDFRGCLVSTSDGKVVDYYGEKLKQGFRILCDPANVIILNGTDTLYSGNYEKMIKFDQDKLPTNIGKNQLPTAILNPTCNVPLKRISEISDCFNNNDIMQFQFGKYFGCVDTLEDIKVNGTYFIGK